ncbi:CAP domain-containing protein [Salinibaculum rarum]|uniref:CAP domain-containing protein n=1 Tax=Salinibaculum rarum TaxID=3058903 RepID=UPI00265D9089|nr:CAP domain-containing protein [Salinibaculum sp. KK48]
MDLRRRQVLLGLSGAVSAGLAGCTEELPIPDSESAPEGEGDTGETTSAEPAGSTAGSGSSSLVFSRIGLETAIREQVNEYRTENDEEKLRWEPLYQEGCRQHSEAMAAAGTLQTSVGGASASERVRKKTNCGADITITRLSRVDELDAAAQRVIQEWRQESQARTKILDPVSTRIGVGVETSADNYVYVTAAYC